MIATTVYLNRSFPTFWSDANETYDSDARLMATRACPLTALISDLKYIPTDVRALLMTSVSSREMLAHGEGVRLIKYFIINCNSHLTLQLFTTTLRNTAMTRVRAVAAFAHSARRSPRPYRWTKSRTYPQWATRRLRRGLCPTGGSRRA